MDNDYLKSIENEMHFGAWSFNFSSNNLLLSENTQRLLELALCKQELNIKECLKSFSHTQKYKLLKGMVLAQRGTKNEMILSFKNKKLKIIAEPEYNRAPGHKMIGLKGILLDVTREEENQEMTLFALESAGIGLWDWDIINNHLHWDARMFHVFDVDPRQFSNHYDAWRNCVHPDDLEASEQLLQEAVAGKVRFDTYFRIIDSKQEVRFIHARSKLIKDENGQPIRMIGTNMDVTQLKQKELDLLEQQRITDQSLRLAQLGEISAGIGHEINNPLFVAFSNIELMKRNLGAKQLANIKNQKYFSRIENSLERIKKIVESLRSLSLEKENTLEVFDHANSIHENIALLETVSVAKNIQIQTHLTENLSIKGNITRFNQVIINLITNAFDSINETNRSGMVEIHSKRIDNQLSIQIIDNGAGIPTEISEKIFQNFFTTKRHKKGTGIGLSLSKKIIDSMNGQLKLVSTSSEGSSFEINLPLYVDIRSKKGEIINSAI